MMQPVRITRASRKRRCNDNNQFADVRSTTKSRASKNECKRSNKVQNERQTRAHRNRNHNEANETTNDQSMIV